MSRTSLCAFAVPLPGQCDPVLHTVDGLVTVGEEAMYVPQFTMRICSPFTWRGDPVLYSDDRLVKVGEEAMDVPQFTMRIQSSFTWPV
jgi:hypothetical protein